MANPSLLIRLHTLAPYTFLPKKIRLHLSSSLCIPTLTSALIAIVIVTIEAKKAMISIIRPTTVSANKNIFRGLIQTGILLTSPP